MRPVQSSGCNAAGFYKYHVCKTAGFQGYCRPEERDMWAVQVTMPQTLLNEIQQFFLNKHFSDCWKTLVNFKSFEKVDFGHLCQCFHCFYGGVDLPPLDFEGLA